MAIIFYTAQQEYAAIESLLRASLNLPDAYLEDVSSVLMLKALHNVAAGNRPFQKNVEDVKDVIPIAFRSEHYHYRFHYRAKCNNQSCHIIIRLNKQNGYEYAQITFTGVAQTLKSQMVANDRLIIIKRKSSDVFDIYKIPLSDTSFTENEDFVAINPTNAERSSSFSAPSFEADTSSHQKQTAIFSETSLREFAYESFKELLRNFGQDKMLEGSAIKSSTINQVQYGGISLPTHFGADNLIAAFDTLQTKASLSSSGTQRFFELSLDLPDHPNSYFTTQWSDTDTGNLTFNNLSRYVKDVSNGLYSAAKDNGTYILLKHDVFNYPLNQILYGPPGTGKTHNAINHAVAIATGRELQKMVDSEKADPAYRRAVKKEFDALVESGQIQFVTFHQSYSYEEFVEGIKPSVNGSNVEYSIEDGIFKRICLKAAQKNAIKDFEEVFGAFASELLESGNKLLLSTPNGRSPFSVSINSNGSCVVKPENADGPSMTIPKKAIRDFLERGLGGNLAPYTTAIADHITQNHPTITDQEDNSGKKFVLIIDEINRGNISKIFGELITLIEDSKRIGNDEELRIRLTYSGAGDSEMFGVPKNVYIIGTMNSADRSIALIDTALRRRFTFTEYTADPSVLSDNVEGIDLRRMLKKMNERIEFLLDRDHLLGHAYFLGVKTKNDLCGVFRNKILPLLEEYFFGSAEKIQQVLGDNTGWGKTDDRRLIKEDRGATANELFGNAEDHEDKIIYQINAKLAEGRYDEIEVDYFTSIYTTR